MDDHAEQTTAWKSGRQTAVIQAAKELGLLGVNDRQVDGRFSDALIAEAKRVSGITDLRIYALIKVALEDDFGERLLERKGSIPKGALCAG